MTRNIVYFSAALIIMLYSCDLGTTKTAYLNNGTDTFQRTFFPDGNIESEIHYKNGVKHGLYKWYYDNGNIDHLGKNKNGVEDSTWTWYYTNQTLHTIHNWMDGSTIGNYYSYYPDGQLNLYAFYHYGGHLAFLRKHDSISNNVINEYGTPASIYINTNKLSKGDTQTLVVILGLLQNWDYDLLISDISSNKFIVLENTDDLNKLTNVYYGKKYTLKKAMDKKGNYKWEIKIRIKDNAYDRDFTRIDTLKFVVE